MRFEVDLSGLLYGLKFIVQRSTSLSNPIKRRFASLLRKARNVPLASAAGGFEIGTCDLLGVVIIDHLFNVLESEGNGVLILSLLLLVLLAVSSLDRSVVLRSRRQILDI